MLKEINVLIVEDFSITAMDLSKTLQNIGCNISGIVKTGEEAIQKAGQNKPDLVLMDIMLKGYYNGIETARYIQKQSDIHIIYITALTDDETFLKAYSTKPLAILTKPFNEMDLKNAINAILRKTARIV